MKKSVKIALAAVAAIALAGIIIAVALSGKNREETYNNAVSMYESGDLKGAYKMFTEIYDYSDSAVYAKRIYDETFLENIRALNKGQTLFFGRYEQDGNTSNGPEEIEWLVLDVRGEDVLVISKYALEAQPFDTPSGTSDWESSAIRRWLNKSFLFFSFDPVEQSRVIETFLEDDSGKTYATADRVFLLSAKEAEEYMQERTDRICEATDQAVVSGVSKKIAKVYDKYGRTVEAPATCNWWLRSCGTGENTAISVYPDGQINNSGNVISDDYRAARPAMWIYTGTDE